MRNVNNSLVSLQPKLQVASKPLRCLRLGGPTVATSWWEGKYLIKSADIIVSNYLTKPSTLPANGQEAKLDHRPWLPGALPSSGNFFFFFEAFPEIKMRTEALPVVLKERTKAQFISDLTLGCLDGWTRQFLCFLSRTLCLSTSSQKYQVSKKGHKVYLFNYDLTGSVLQALSLLCLDGWLLTFILDLSFGEAKENADLNNKKGRKPIMWLELQIQVGPTLCGGVVTTLAEVSCVF